MTRSMQQPIASSDAFPDPDGRSFIEVQFPVSKLSKECYKERKAVAGQTLTGLGKWWGRKPLTLVRALILGLLLPATNDPEKDREIFLALMTMDDDGLWQRVTGNIPAREVHKYALPREQAEYLDSSSATPRWRSGLSYEDRRSMQRRAFFRMNYDTKLTHCKRPEEIDGPSPEAWAKINAHLGTSATSLTELVAELGRRRFGHVPHVGDAFCGGGSIPFEAARLGCHAYGSDLNPVAALLTWGALNIVGGGEEVVERVSAAQRRVFAAVQQQVDEWGIERNEDGWIADAYLYCNEVIDPSTGWKVPLAGSWVIATKGNVFARLTPDQSSRSFVIEICENGSDEEMRQAVNDGTWRDGVRSPVDRDGHWLPPGMRQITAFETLRGRNGLRMWANDEIVPRDGDVFCERLYCIRWLDPKTGKRIYRHPTPQDLEREHQVLRLLEDRFHNWQETGIVPNRRIQPGRDINRPTNGRGWTHWHHLFNPRQLLEIGLFAETALTEGGIEGVATLLLIGRLANWNSRLTIWDVGKGGGIGGGGQTFYKPSLSTPFVNYSCRTLKTLAPAFNIELTPVILPGTSTLRLGDARQADWMADYWITDPGYADSVNYEELSEFFLAWYDDRLLSLFPDWYSDSKRSLAAAGIGTEFRVALSDCYKRLTNMMSKDGFQIVMFTHQDPGIWADLALVLWSSGLRVESAWTIATETGATGVKQGNYVQGTVCLVLRKRQGERFGDLADLYPDVQAEVERQLESMLVLDDKDDPNFGDSDYQLAAYAAALRVLTSYNSIGEIDVERELRRTRGRHEKSPLAGLIEQAVKIASDVLVPEGFDRATWRSLTPEERLYLKGIEVEAAGESRDGVYQEMARGYGAADYRDMLASRAANATRLKTPSEFAGQGLRASAGFGSTLLRQVLYGVYVTATHPERDPKPARDYLRRELPDYWNKRATIIEFLRYLSTRPSDAPHWSNDLHAARLLLGSIESDSM